MSSEVEQGAGMKGRIWSFVSLLCHLIKLGAINSTPYGQWNRLASISGSGVKMHLCRAGMSEELENCN